MKKSIVLLALLSLGVQADVIDNIVKKIKSKRESNISQEELKTIPSPIVETPIDETPKDGNKTKTKSKKVSLENFELKAIMNNKAFINDRWVAIGEKIGDYQVVDIMDDSVYLSNGKKTKMVFFKKNDHKTIQIIKK